MVNEDRLRYMIKMSEFDSSDGKECRPMTQYSRKDYISLELLKSLISGSGCYILIVVFGGMYLMESIMQQINQIDIPAVLKTLLVLYIVFMVCYLMITGIISNFKYTYGRKKIKKYYGNLKKVNQIYEREERLKMPAPGDWD